VYGFGATIERDQALAPDTMGLTLYDPTQPSDARPKVMTIADTPGGHRHKSAVHFCAMQLAQLRVQKRLGEAAIAIVASQDGSLSVCAIAGTGVALIRPYLLRGRRLR
jgi:hypothetical protein